MGKNQKRKRNRSEMLRVAAAQMHTSKKAATLQSEETLENDNSSSDDEESPTAISESDLAITLKTLQKLAQTPELLQTQAFKPLRKSLHPLVLQQMQIYDRVDYSARVTSAFSNKKWAEALLNLQACKDFQIRPKQGTIQRWVREVTATTNDCEESYKLKLLFAILKLGDGKANIGSSNNKHDAGIVIANTLKDDDGLVSQPAWKIEDADYNDIDKPTDDDNIISPPESKIIYRETAAERVPPNHYDLFLHMTVPNAIVWDPTPLPVQKHDVDFLPRSCLLQNALTHKECHQIVQTATHLGFRPDHPVSIENPTGIDSCEWFVDASIRDKLYARVQQCLPQTVENEKGDTIATLKSINPRWRLFRYGQDCVYRPHIDGSWPESRLNEEGAYECDESGATRSYYTLLMYLNQGFEGGETKFYFASPEGMVCRGIVPLQGALMIFPQANTASLIHEGSRVTKGTKYVVRTDVLYELKTKE
jgi:hypothetical protein